MRRSGLPDDPPGPTADPYAEIAWREVRQVLDGELNALPDRLRVPLVLCYLEALTRDEAAGRLGWSLRTTPAAPRGWSWMLVGVGTTDPAWHEWLSPAGV